MQIKTLTTLIILINCFMYKCNANSITYRNHDSIDYIIYAFEISEKGNYDIFTIVTLPAHETIDREYDEPLSTIARIIISDHKGGKRTIEKPFSYTTETDYTIHIYEKRIEISQTFRSSSKNALKIRLHNILLQKIIQ